MRGSAQLGQVDVVGLQAAQRTLDRGEYPTPRGALPVGVVAHGAAERRRQYHAVAAPLELADDLLGVAVAIRSVDEVDPASSALWMARTESSGSGLPIDVANSKAPSLWGLTLMPVWHLSSHLSQMLRDLLCILGWLWFVDPCHRRELSGGGGVAMAPLRASKVPSPLDLVARYNLGYGSSARGCAPCRARLLSAPIPSHPGE